MQHILPCALKPLRPADVRRIPVRLINTECSGFGSLFNRYYLSSKWFSHLLDCTIWDNVPFSPSAATSLGDLPPHITLDMFPECRLILPAAHSESAPGTVECILKPRRSSVCICCLVGPWQHLSTWSLFWNSLIGPACCRVNVRL